MLAIGCSNDIYLISIMTLLKSNEGPSFVLLKPHLIHLAVLSIINVDQSKHVKAEHCIQYCVFRKQIISEKFYNLSP